MKKIFILLCMLISITVNAKSFKYEYIYSGDADGATMSYERINKGPVIVNFIEEIEAIQLIWDDTELMFYIKDALPVKEGETVLIATQKDTNAKTTFLVNETGIIFIVGKYGYLITNTPKPNH